MIWCCCVKNLLIGETRVLTKEDFHAWYNPDFTLIGHNLSSFDVPVLNRLWDAGIDLGSCIDTLVLSYLFKPHLEDGHSLDAWGRRLKFPKGVFSDWSKLSEEMLGYCKNDVELTHKVYNALSKKMTSYGYSELSCEIEHKIRLVINEQEKNGFWFDRDRANLFRQELRREQDRLSGEITRLFPPVRTKVAEYPYRITKDGLPYASHGKHLQKYNDVIYVEKDTNGQTETWYECYDLIPFNLGSPKQRVEKLLEIGWRPEKFTKPSKTHPKGFPQVDEDALLAFAEESKRPELQALAEWLVIQGRASMLDTWFNNLGDDSRIHGKVFTCGAATRRMTHNSPNTANIPSGHKAKYGKECRSFWGVEPERNLCLVGYDAAGLETAGLCHYLNNSVATSVLLRPKPDDVHTANARALTEALGRPIDREWGAKTSFYAWLYGAYPPKLGSIVKGPPSDGEIVIETFFRNVPGLKDLIKEVHDEFRRNSGRLETIDGGFVWCPSINAALNYKIQSAGAILMKLTAILLDEEAKKLSIPLKKVGDIHDEGQLEVQQKFASELGALAVRCITEAGVRLGFNVVLSGDYKIGTDWSMTH